MATVCNHPSLNHTSHHVQRQFQRTHHHIRDLTTLSRLKYYLYFGLGLVKRLANRNVSTPPHFQLTTNPINASNDRHGANRNSNESKCNIEATDKQTLEPKWLQEW